MAETGFRPWMARQDRKAVRDAADGAFAAVEGFVVVEGDGQAGGDLVALAGDLACGWRSPEWTDSVLWSRFRKRGDCGDVDAVRGFAAGNSQFLSRQFDLYAPDWIVCCGSAVAEILFEEVLEWDSDWAITSRGIWHTRFRGATYLDYWHPNVRYPANLVCYGLIDAVRELLGEGIASP